MLVTNPLPFTGGNPAGGGGSGTVTSVGIAFAASLSAILSVSGSPVTASGDLTLAAATQTANRVFAGPTTGSAAAPTFRALVVADIPDLSAVYQPLDADLTAIAALSSTGIAVRTASNTWAQRTVVDAGSSRVTVSNPAGVVGNITLDVAEANLNLASIGGTLGKSQVSSSGTWTAAEIPSLDTSKLTSGTLGVARGGTGAVTFTAYAVLCAGTTSTGAFQNVSGLGTATNVLQSAGAGALPTWGAVTGSNFATQSANVVFAGPTSGGAAAPAFRALVGADMPAATIAAQSDGATITIDASTLPAAFGIATVTLAGNRTLTWSNGTAGQRVLFIITQDGTGTRTLAYTGATCKFSTDLASPTLSTTAAAVDIQLWICVSSGVFRLLSKNFGF